jgi:thymidylate synthase
MPLLVSGATAVDAWLTGCAHLSDNPEHRIRNLVTEIIDPMTIDCAWYTRFDPTAVYADDRLSVVARVLLPDSSKKAGETREQFYARCSNLLERALRSRRLHSAWGGTYFQRLVSLDGSENQIERAIRVLTEWGVRAETAIVAHTSTPKIDSLRKRGSPCLQFIEIVWRPNNIIDLVAVYRNHDFLNKALGNFIGLSRLLAFIASESGKEPGQIVCHSVGAYTAEIGKLRALIQR